MSQLRKLRRKKIKEHKKDFKATMNMISKMGDHCLSCQKSFDKNNKEHVTTWNVVVREKENKVNLYCPECWDNAHKFIDNLKEQMNATRTEEE